MQRKNQKLLDFQAPNRQITAKIGIKNKYTIVSGDDKNNIHLWRFGENKPIDTFSNQSSNQAQTETTQVQFNYNETEIYSGSSRGVINVWDITKKKCKFFKKALYSLRGHTAPITCLEKFPGEDSQNLIISGSYDTIIKMWDLRTKESIAQFKGHQMQINTVSISPDSRWFASGSQDGQIRIWDIYQNKQIFSSGAHENPVTCSTFNPQYMLLATGSNDKTIKYWDLQNFKELTTTKKDTTGIQQIAFSDNGKCLFAASNETLKVWGLEHHKDSIMLDNIQSGWKGILDLRFNEQENNIYGICSNQNNFNLWGCTLTKNKAPQRKSQDVQENTQPVNKVQNKQNLQFDRNATQNNETKEKKEEWVIEGPINKDFYQRMDLPNLQDTEEVEEDLDEYIQEFEDEEHHINQITPQKNYINARAKMVPDSVKQLNEFQINNIQQQENIQKQEIIQQQELASNNDQKDFAECNQSMQFKSFYVDNDTKNKKSLETIKNLTINHERDILQDRYRQIYNIVISAKNKNFFQVNQSIESLSFAQ